MFSSQEITNIILYIIIISSFINIFMLIFAIKYENIFIEKQINNLVKKILSDHATLPDNMKPIIRGVLKSINKNKKKSEIIQEKEEYLKKSLFILSVIIITGIFIIYNLASNSSIDFTNMIKCNIIIVIVTVLVQVSFIYLYLNRYNSYDTEYTKQVIIEAIKENL